MQAQFSLASYSRTISGNLDDLDRYCALMHQLPRQFHELTAADQAAALSDRPPLTGTRWDALLAAVVEHIARLHSHNVPDWVNEPDRFLTLPWVISTNPVIAADSVLYAPASFIRHSVFRDPLDLDARGARNMPGSPDPGRPLNREALTRAFKALEEQLASQCVRAHASAPP